jgi:hypothetical protein
MMCRGEPQKLFRKPLLYPAELRDRALARWISELRRAGYCRRSSAAPGVGVEIADEAAQVEAGASAGYDGCSRIVPRQHIRSKQARPGFLRA